MQCSTLNALVTKLAPTVGLAYLNSKTLYYHSHTAATALYKYDNLYPCAADYFNNGIPIPTMEGMSITSPSLTLGKVRLW